MAERSLKLFGLKATWGSGSGLSIKRAGLPMNTSYANRFGGRNWLYGLLPGAQLNYSEIAGDRWRNSIVAASLSWIGRNLPQAPPCVYKTDENGKEEIVTDHPLTKLLKRPNPYYDGRTLRQATFLSLISGRGANAYWWIKKDNIGRPIELWYLPHFDCYPVWTTKTTTDNWIEYYIYRVNGIYYRLENDAVVHFREGMNPYNPRSGYDALESADREIVTDNEHSGYEASLMRNFGIPGAIISGVTETDIFDEPSQKLLKKQFEEASQHDNKFRPIVLSGNVKVDRVAFSPADMLIEKMAYKAETRICAIIGVPAVVLGLSVGLEHSTYSNMEEARRAAWQDGIIPRLELINSECDTQLLQCFDLDPSLRTGADYRRVPALQETEDNKFARLTAAVGGPWMTPNEARAEAGLLAYTEEVGDELYPAKSSAPTGAEDSGTQNTPTKSWKAKGESWITVHGRHILLGDDGEPVGGGTVESLLAGKGNGEHDLTPRPAAKLSAKEKENMHPASPAERKQHGVAQGYSDVHIHDDPENKVTWKGKSVVGKTKAIYKAETEDAQSVAKFARIEKFTEELPDILKRNEKNITQGKNTAEAHVIKLLHASAFRIGGDEDTGAKVKAYGATTLLKEHAKVDGDTVHFSFPGKGGVKQEHSIKDAEIAEIIKAKQANPETERLFETSDSKVRDYLHTIDGEFKNHDFRTWNATSLALKMVSQEETPATSKEREAAVQRVADVVAKKLGDTAKVVLDRYIDPKVFELWQ